ncbi:MAG: ATP-binding protein [Bradymonadaceae bacterium]
MTATLTDAFEDIEAPDGIEERRVNEEPDPVDCRICGDEVEPTYNPFREVWLLPTPICSDCHERKERTLRWKQRFDDWWEEMSGVPRLLRQDAHRDEIELIESLQKLVQLHPREHDSSWWAVYLHGPVGTGKSVQSALAIGTFLSHWLLKRRVGVSAKYLDVTEFLGRLRESFDNDSIEVDVESYRTAGLLVLDDLGREKTTAWSAEVLYKLINHRYSERLPTIFCSNLSLDELQGGANLLKNDSNGEQGALKADFDDRLVDRIWMMCGGSRDSKPDKVEAMTTHYRSPRRTT